MENSFDPNSLEIVEAVGGKVVAALVEHLVPLPVGLLLLVSEHRVPRHVRRVSRDVEVGVLDAAPHVVVLASPAPELVRVAVHPLKVLPWLGRY